MIDLRGVETFFWVATLKSFRAAADKLHASQPAISQRISQLEQALGASLLDRDKRGVRLTAKGQELFAHAERMLEIKHEMLRIARSDHLIGGTVCIGVAETIVQLWLPRLLERVHAQFPDVVLEIEVDTSTVLRSHLLSRRIDLAFMMGPMDEPGAENIPLCAYPLAWVASPRLELGGRALSLHRVAEWPIITYPATTKPYQVIRERLLQSGVRRPRMYGSASLSTAIRMCQDGIGTCVIAPAVIERELYEKRLEILKIDSDELPELYFTATWLQGMGSHAAEIIAKLAVEVASGMTR